MFWKAERVATLLQRPVNGLRLHRKSCAFLQQFAEGFRSLARSLTRQKKFDFEKGWSTLASLIGHLCVFVPGSTM